MTNIKEVKEKDELKNPLIKKKVTIALIKKQQSSLYRDIELSTLATGGSKSFICPVDRSGHLVNPLTKEERIFLEN